jgi:hypothetical protein
MTLKIKSPRLQIFLSGFFMNLMFLVTNPAQAALIHNTPGSDENSIAMGASRDYVLPFYRGADESSLSFAGSITIIDDGMWGLLTRHQSLQNYSDASSLYGAYATKVVSNANTSAAMISVKDMFVFDDRDMALVQFHSVIPGITPIQRYRGDVTIGTEGYITGFGERQYINDPVATFTGDRRSGFDVVQTSGTNFFITRVNDPFSPNYRPSEAGGRVGSSGGAFEVDAMLGGSLFGGSGVDVNIFGSGTFFNYIPNERIDFIQSSVPEPTSFSLFALSSLYGLLGYRRRKSEKYYEGVQTPVSGL